MVGVEHRGKCKEDVVAGAYHPVLALSAGLVMLILERNREREPSREKDRENRREGEGG